MTKHKKRKRKSSLLRAAAEVAKARALLAKIRLAIVEAKIRELESVQARRLSADILSAAAKVAQHNHAGQFQVAEQLLADPELLPLSSCPCSS